MITNNDISQSQNFKPNYESLWKAIIRPPKEKYNESELGNKTFYYQNKKIIRSDYNILVTKKNIIKSSFFQITNSNEEKLHLPLIIYLHGNCSSRLEGLYLLPFLIPYNINLFVYDFAGCGLSEGEFISLGFHEKNDLKIIINFLFKFPHVKKIGLWGHSMGAATSLMYTPLDNRIKCVCSDSSFSEFFVLAKELAKKKINFPDVILNGVLNVLKNTIKNKNNFDINEINPLNDVKKINVPVFFVHAMKDELINLEHSLKLYENCSVEDGKKFILICEGSHNSIRPKNVIEKICNFFNIYLNN